MPDTKCPLRNPVRDRTRVAVPCAWEAKYTGQRLSRKERPLLQDCRTMTQEASSNLSAHQKERLFKEVVRWAWLKNGTALLRFLGPTVISTSCDPHGGQVLCISCMLTWDMFSFVPVYFMFRLQQLMAPLPQHLIPNSLRQHY